jgi:hypothetical protein
MIILDSNIISTFCLIDQFPLLFKLFPKHDFGIPAAVYDEIMEAIQLGYHFLAKIQFDIDNQKMHLISLTADEMRSKQNMPRTFGNVDIECIIVSQRETNILLTNDKRIKNFCQSNFIKVHDLPNILRALWENKIVPDIDVQKIIMDIEEKENMIIKGKANIFD